MASKNEGQKGKKRQKLDESSDDSSSHESDSEEIASDESFDENMVNWFLKSPVFTGDWQLDSKFLMPVCYILGNPCWIWSISSRWMWL